MGQISAVTGHLSWFKTPSLLFAAHSLDRATPANWRKEEPARRPAGLGTILRLSILNNGYACLMGGGATRAQIGLKLYTGLYKRLLHEALTRGQLCYKHIKTQNTEHITLPFSSLTLFPSPQSLLCYLPPRVRPLNLGLCFFPSKVASSRPSVDRFG